LTLRTRTENDAALGAAAGAAQNLDIASVAAGLGNLFGKK